jgi:hypothetical protein
LVLLAIANSKYEFIYCDIGTNGRISDEGVAENTKFYEKFVGGYLQLPPPRKPQNVTIDLQNVFVRGEALILREDFLKPFSQNDLNPERNFFNYCLSRARGIVEKFFGIMASSFRIFHTQINFKSDLTETTVIACCVLRNYEYLRRRYTSFGQEESNMEKFVGDENVFIPL